MCLSVHTWSVHMQIIAMFVYTGSSMEFQCFEIQIKTEADIDECPHDDKPSTGMFAVSDDIFCALSITILLLQSHSGHVCLTICLSLAFGFFVFLSLILG